MPSFTEDITNWKGLCMYDYEKIASEYGYPTSLCVRMLTHIALSGECDDMKPSEAVEKLKPFFLVEIIEDAISIVREFNQL